MIVAGVSSLFFKWALQDNWYILLAAFLAGSVGLMVEIINGKRKTRGDQQEGHG
jgi:uncharacterized membrane protein YjjP (DUF1212 family)